MDEKNRRWWQRAPVLLLLVAAPALAQSSGTPDPAPGMGEPLMLSFKFRVGDRQTWKQTIKSDLTVTPTGAQVHESQLPMAVSAVATTTEKVNAVENGTGTLEWALASERIRDTYLGKTRVTTIRNGKATVTMNGKPLAGAELAKVAPRLKRVAADRVRTIQRDPRGLETVVQGARADAGSWGDLLVLADKPVRVGDSWTHDERFRPTVYTPVGRQVIAQTEFHFTFTLKSVETAGGRRVAVVQVRAQSTPIEATKGEVRKFSRNYDGTCRFDIDRGALLAGHFNVDSSITLAVPAAERQKSAFAPESIRIDGLSELTFTEVETPK